MCPEKAGGASLMKRTDPTNYPIQVGSLTAGACGNMRSQCAVTKSPEGEFVCNEQTTVSQSGEAKTQAVG